jgi:ribonuclease Z
MAIIAQVLGNPGRDNSLLIVIDSGQSITRLLIDCGDGCLSSLSIAEIQSIDALMFSHLHMDHVAGFDAFFRCTFGRTEKPNVILGPPGTGSIIQHRFQGYWWNLCADNSATWTVTDLTADARTQSGFKACDGFQSRENREAERHDGVILDTPGFEMKVIELQHNGPVLGYRVNEKPRTNVNKQRMKELGLPPGPWVRELKNSTGGAIDIGGNSWQLEELRRELLVESAGGSAAYITDFLLDTTAHERLADWLSGCDTVVCEAQYRHSDLELATRNHHTTTKQVGQLAAAAEIGELILFHLSDRYSHSDWLEMLDECRAEFPSTGFPGAWDIT